MNKFKKIGACALTALMAVSGGVFAAANTGSVTASGESAASQAWKTEMTIGGWIQFYDTDKVSYEDQIRDLAKSGMNFMPLPDYGSFTVGGSGNVPGCDTDEFWSNLNEIAQELNMYYVLHKGYNVADFAESYATVKDLANCIGYHMKDEPSAAQMDALAELCLSFKEQDPSRIPYVNLYPSYAGATNLGGTYRDYVTKWVNLMDGNTDMLYFDHYPFTQQESVRSTYFSDLEVIRDVAYKNGKIPTGGFTQMGSWNGMRRPSVDEARWSVNSLLTYGLKHISHFCWVAPQYVPPENGGEGMGDFVLTSTGEKTDLYEPMTILNWQSRQLGKVLMNIDVKHAYHTAKVPTGTEALPSGFVLQPANSKDDFIFSIAYSKDTNEPYLLVFNKALEGEAKEYSFRVDTSTGVTGIRYYKPTDYTMDTLPDPTDLDTLVAPEEVDTGVTGGTFTDTFKPGEMKVYKLLGENVEIAEELQAPESNVKGGVYVGPQKVSLVTGDKGADIYYTLDGSYPDPDSSSTYLYDGVVTLGAWGTTSTHTIRAVSVRGNEVSELLELDVIITDASRNAALGMPVKLYSKDLSTELTPSAFNGGSLHDTRVIVDGAYDPWTCISAKDAAGNNCYAWAVVDLGEETWIDKILYSFWHNQAFKNVEIRLATQSDFSDAKTVYTADSMQCTAGAGTQLSLEPTKARYVMLYNEDNAWDGDYSVFTEVEVFTVYNGGTDLIADTENWQAINDGEYTNDGTKIQDSSAYNQSTWNKAYSYNAKKYKNFMIDVNMSIDVEDPSCWGFAGIQILRKKTTTNQDCAKGNGIVVGVEPKGRVLLWNKEEIGAKDANISGWSVGSAFNMKIVVYDGLITVAINGKAVMTENLPEWKDKEGYISFHTGLLPATLSSLRILELDESFAFPAKGAAVNAVSERKEAVEAYLSAADIAAMLGNTVQITDTAGNTHTVRVEDWTSEDYDRTAKGATSSFTAKLNREDLETLGLSNVYGVQAKATIFVKADIDRSVVENLLAVAESLNAYEYEEESWNQLQLKVEAANDILNNEFLAQSDVNVGMFQLYDAIYKYLVYIGDVSELQAAIDSANAIDLSKYESYSTENFQAVLATAQAYLDGTFKTYEGVLDEIERLEAATDALVEKQTAVGNEFVGGLPTIEEVKAETKGCGASLAGMGGVAAVLTAVGAAAVLKKKDEE